MKIGLIADMHGDLAGFQRACALFDEAGVSQILCAGDIVERGPHADDIITIMQQRGVVAIAGNHEHTVIHNQARWRAADNSDRLRELGRVVSDATLYYISRLPDTLTVECGGVRVFIAHGVPWSDVLGIFPGSRHKLIERIFDRYAVDIDVMLLGHTHHPMVIRGDGMMIVNPGSVYAGTIRDSHTCAVLTLPERAVTVYDLDTRTPTTYDDIRL